MKGRYNMYMHLGCFGYVARIKDIVVTCELLILLDTYIIISEHNQYQNESRYDGLTLSKERRSYSFRLSELMPAANIRPSGSKAATGRPGRCIRPWNMNAVMLIWFSVLRKQIQVMCSSVRQTPYRMLLRFSHTVYLMKQKSEFWLT